MDKPYTCMFNPLLPAVGIMFSGVTIGYIDQSVWITFFIIIVCIIASYFIFVIPRKIRIKLKKENENKINKGGANHQKRKRKSSDEDESSSFVKGNDDV